MDNPTPMPPAQRAINRLLWRTIAILALLDVAGTELIGMKIDAIGMAGGLFACAGLLGLSWFYRTVRPDAAISLFAQTTTQLILISLTLTIFSYLGTTLAFPLTDAALIHIDHLLHFDWRAYLAWVNGRPWLASCLSFVYRVTGPEIFFPFFFLFIYKRTDTLQRFVLAFTVATLLTIVLSTLFPALGGYLYYNPEMTQFPHLHPAAAREHERVLLGLRDHSLMLFSPPAKGLVTFPSFHVAAAVLVVYASLPIRWLLWPMIPLNLLVLFSTPVDGGHYLIDNIGGIAVALLGIWLAEAGFRRALRGDNPAPLPPA